MVVTNICNAFSEAKYVTLKKNCVQINKGSPYSEALKIIQLYNSVTGMCATPENGTSNPPVANLKMSL